MWQTNEELNMENVGGFQMQNITLFMLLLIVSF